MCSFLCSLDKKIGNTLFYMALLGLFCQGWWLDENPFFDFFLIGFLIVKYISYCLLILRIGLLAGRSFFYVVLSILVLFVFHQSSINSGFHELFWLILLVISAKGADFKVIIKLYLVSVIFVLLYAFVLCYLGWSADLLKHRGFLCGHSFGIDNPNILALLFFEIVLLVLCLQNWGKTISVFIVCWISSLFIYFITLSLTVCLALFILPLVYLILKNHEINSYIIAFVPLLGLLVSVFFCCYFGPGLGSTTFESRFSLANLVYQHEGISLMGNNIHKMRWITEEMQGNQGFTIDCMYLVLFLRDGLIPSALVFIFLSLLYYVVAKSKNIIFLAVLLVMAAIALMEPFPITYHVSFMPLFLFAKKANLEISRFAAIIVIVVSLTLSLGIGGFLKIYHNYVTPEHYMVIELSTPNIGAGINDVSGVVLHHTAIDDIESSLDVLRSEETQVSCHVLIAEDGTRYVLANPEQITWHAGWSSLHGKTGCNSFTIGIEFNGNTEERPLTKRQIASAIEYLCPLIEKYAIPLENIVTHQMIRDEWIKNQNDTLCPTKCDIVQSEYHRFMKELKKKIARELSEDENR